MCAADKDSPNRRVIAIDLGDPNPASWKVVVPEPQVPSKTRLIGGRMVGAVPGGCAEPAAGVRRLDGTEAARSRCPALARLPISTAAAISSSCGTPSARRCARHRVSLRPGAWSKHRRSRRRRRRSIPSSLKRTRCSRPRKDGTRVPFFLTAKKGLTSDGGNPTMMYGYGGFSVSRCQAIERTCQRGWSLAAFSLP